MSLSGGGRSGGRGGWGRGWRRLPWWPTWTRAGRLRKLTWAEFNERISPELELVSVEARPLEWPDLSYLFIYFMKLGHLTWDEISLRWVDKKKCVLPPSRRRKEQCWTRHHGGYSAAPTQMRDPIWFGVRIPVVEEGGEVRWVDLSWWCCHMRRT